MAMIVKRIATGFFDGHWSLLTTINGGLAGMVRKDWLIKLLFDHFFLLFFPIPS